MKNARPIRRALRRARRLERRPRRFCPLCIELDHSAGRNHDSSLTFPLCQKHHADVTENRRQADVSMIYQSNPIERVKHALQATSIFLEMLAKAMWRWSDLLDEGGNMTNKT
jgi:hypothetical protein